MNSISDEDKISIKKELFGNDTYSMNIRTII